MAAQTDTAAALRADLRNRAIDVAFPPQDASAMKRFVPLSLAFFAVHVLFIGATIALTALN